MIENLKAAFISPLVLALPYSGGHLTLGTDACKVQVGCALLRSQTDDRTKPIGYQSCSLTDTDQGYDSTQQKGLVIVWSELLLFSNLEGYRFTIRNDHDALKWILNITNSTRRLAEDCLRLSKSNFVDVHRAIIIHEAADALS